MFETKNLGWVEFFDYPTAHLLSVLDVFWYRGHSKHKVHISLD
jgi:hypothetical protein